jgi:DNA-binding NtrC family response regulator/tetratricopeptide (TPR) repeat protein
LFYEGDGMELLADRFVVGDGGTALDLATGDRVELTITSAGGESEQRRWALRCDARHKLRHPAFAGLVDYGIVGDSRRFEACRLGQRATTPQAEGLVTIERPAVAAIGELFERPDSVRPQVTGLWGPQGAGKRTVVDELARIARLHGFVPVAARVLPAFPDALSGRTLFVIDDGEEREGWRVLLSAMSGACRPHVLLFVGREEPRSLDGIGLTPVSVDVLVQAVRPPDATDSPRFVAIRRLAAQSGGWPGRFARLLWRESETPIKDTRYQLTPHAVCRGTLRVAEQPVAYGVEPRVVPPVDGREWPVPDEIASLGRRLETGERLIAEGRHAPGERMLRQAIGALARRQDWARVGEGSLALASLLLRRGRARDAQATLKAAADSSGRDGDESRLIDVAILRGVAAIELARIDDAETTLSAAAAAARAKGDRARTGRALAVLARALFWRGHYEAAEQALQSIDHATMADPTAVAVAGLRSSVAVGSRHFDRAIAGAANALDLAQRAGDARLIAEAAGRAAFAHLAVGDVAAVERDVVMSIAAARTAREPLVATRVRLLLVEGLRRSGRKPAAARLLQKITRLGASTLPPILRARCDLWGDLLQHAGSAEEVFARHAAATGLDALRLFSPLSRGSTSNTPHEIMVDDIVGILDLCQTSDDEPAVLGEVCRRVRARLHGAATGIAVPGGGGGYVLLAGDGGRLDLTIAERTAIAGVAIAPHRYEDRIEAAAPVRYGGSTIGVLVARWTIGTLHDLTPAGSLLTTTAAAVAPIVSAALVRNRRPPGSTMAELLGSSEVMADVRRAVERAAPAPFAVLVEGESGSGKELVARAIHRSSSRRDRPFCTLNCAALPDDLVEAELFGHARGAFTGAIAERTGVFEEAHGGTLMLDEIGELSPRAQAKVLRVIQEGELRRIGDNVSRRVDVRIVSATNRDLRSEAAAGRFRLDLLYRLDVVRIVVPALRERREDIPALAEHIWREAAARVGSRATLAASTVAALARYDWPGNVRELQNVLASLVVRCSKRGVVPPTALGPQFADRCLGEASRLDAARRTVEERFVRATLVRTGGHRTRAAEELGVTRQGLAKLMTRLGIAD